MKKLLNDYGMILVLLFIGAVLSVLTLSEQQPVGQSGARRFHQELAARFEKGQTILIVTGSHAEDMSFSDELHRLLDPSYQLLEVVNGDARAARARLIELQKSGTKIDIIAGTQATANWVLFEDIQQDFPDLGGPVVLAPSSYNWPTFLKTENLLNVSDQIAVIAVLAIGMTMVIITAGIDLSVGSLIALSTVIAAWLIVNVSGGVDAGTGGLVMASMGALLVCGAVGLATGVLVSRFRIPPFIVTLAVMLMASGTAYTIAKGTSIYDLPESFMWLGRGTWGGIPVSVILMLLLYLVAHIVMSKTTLGRHIYAVGGNPEAARLSGVPVNRILILVYVVGGLLAGVGGVILASQLNSGSPTYGQMYELKTIAAVVVGGTSLMGGRGKMFGTLIGAFIIGTIENGMNLMGIEPYTQKIVLGFVILAAVWLDIAKQSATRQRS
jgi:ribose transport system permease protein